MLVRPMKCPGLPIVRSVRAIETEMANGYATMTSGRRGAGRASGAREAVDLVQLAEDLELGIVRPRFGNAVQPLEIRDEVRAAGLGPRHQETLVEKRAQERSGAFGIRRVGKRRPQV